MRIIEDITYSIDDIIDQINSQLGFSYVDTSDHEGYILIGNGMKLSLTFDEFEKQLNSAEFSLPNQSFDLVESPATTDIYASGLESASQIVDLINRMLGGSSDDEDID